MDEATSGDDTTVSTGRAQATKLRPPSVRDDRLVRSGLLSTLDSSTASLVLVSAPAGFGKTTAVVDWLRSGSRRNVWVNLDEGDDQPLRFFSLLTEALRPVLDPRRLAGLVTSGDSGLSPSLWSAALLEDIEGCDEPLTVVLDDLHHLTDPVISAALDLVITALPEPVRWVLITRSDPPIRLGRLRAAGHVTEIRADRLAFSEDESADLLARLTGRSWPTTVVRRLNQRIEGWPVGLQLAGLSLVGHDDGEGFVEAFGGDDRYIAEYLIEEVLDREQPDVRQFLLETSVVDEVNAELCAALTGRDDAASILADLDRRNLFIVALGSAADGPGATWYRYHHLFAELLRARLAATSRDRIAELLGIAARWAEEHGELDQALRYHLRRPDRGPATDFAVRHLPALIRQGQIVRHRSWLRQFPTDWVEADPELLLSRAESEVFGIEPQQALKDLDRVERLVEEGAGTVSRGRIELRRAMASFFANDHDACLHHTANALDLIGSAEPSQSAVAHLYRGVVCNIRDDREGAERELAQAATQAERGGNHYAAVSAHMSLGALAIHTGNLDQAGYRFRAIDALADSLAANGRVFPLRGAADVGRGLIAYERLHLEEAATCFRRGLFQLRATTAIDYTLVGYCRWADAESLDGDGGEANEILTEAADYVQHFTGTAPTSMTQALDAANARVLFRQGDLDGARQIERRARVAPDQRRGELLHPAFELDLLSVRLFLAAGEVDQADAAASQLAVDDASDTAFRIERAVVDAELALAANDHQRAQAALGRAIDLAEPGQWVRPFADAPDVARLALATRPPWAGRLSRLVDNGVTSRSDAERIQPLVVPLTSRELEVLQEIVDGRTNAEIAERLYISVGTTKRHIANIFTKLDVGHRAEAAAQARRLGIVD